MPVSDKSALYIDKHDPRKYSSTIEKKVKKLEESGREYNITEGGLLVYQSKGGVGLELNGQAFDDFGAKIICRHLAGNLMTKTRAIKDYHSIYSSVDSIEQEEYLRENAHDASRMQTNSTYYQFFDYRNLGQNIKAIAESLEAGEEVRLMFDSEVHSMGITVARKEISEGESQYVVKFYDPNMTDKHTRVVAPTLESLASLDMTDLLSEADIDVIFPTFDTATMFSPKLRESSDAPKVEVDDVDDLEGSLYHCLMCNVAEPIPKLCRLINAKYKGNYNTFVYSIQAIDCYQKPALLLAMFSGSESALKVYMEYILHADLKEADKSKILMAKVSGRSILSQMLDVLEDHEQDRATLKTYLQEIANTPELGLKAKKEILLALDGEDEPFLYRALQSKHTDAIKVYVETIIASNLNEEAKLELLRASKGSEPGFARACQAGKTESAKVYIESVLNSDLSNASKMQLLTAQTRRYNASGLYGALKHNKLETVKALVDAIITSSLEAKDKVTLLLAEKEKGDNGLYWAIAGGHEELVDYFIQAVKDAELADAFKDRMCHSTIDGDIIALCIEKINAHGSISPDSRISGEELDVVANRHEEGKGHASPRGI